jgi:hypothetical protein
VWFRPHRQAADGLLFSFGNVEKYKRKTIVLDFGWITSDLLAAIDRSGIVIRFIFSSYNYKL